MKTRRKRYSAVWVAFLFFCILLMPLTAFAEGTEIPKGYVEPVSTLGMTRGDVNVFGEFWDRLEEIYLVPYEAYVELFDSYLDRSEGKRLFPVSGAPLIIKRGEVIPEYRIDISYGPIAYKSVDTTYQGTCTGELVMKNLQFGNTETKGILHNGGGACVVTHSSDSQSFKDYNIDLVEAADKLSKYHLPEASFAAVCRIEPEDPATLALRVDGYSQRRDGSLTRSVYVKFKVAGAKMGKAGVVSKDKASGAVDTRANKDKGETSIPISEALAIVIIGAGVALAGAGAGAGGSGDNGRKKKSRYKMCLRKDFGDAIRYDAHSVTVYARIVEVTPEGEEIDRPDLTASLEIFSGGNLTVEGNSVAGNYMGALVSAQSVPGGPNPDSGVLSIKFSGEGGSFQNNVAFRLIGKPYISFPEQGSYLTMTLPMFLGDGEIYETLFVLNDFLKKPTSVKPEVAEGVPLSCEIEETEENQYILKVKNNSSKPGTHQAVKQTFSVGIRAGNEQELAENSLNVELYPEGLSIREVKFDEKGYALIETFDNEATEEWGDVLPTGFVLDFVVPYQDQQGRRTVRVLKPEEFSPVFAVLKGTDEPTTHLAERFKYTIEETVSNLKEYKFAPQEALVEEEGKPYYLTLPISCTYGDQEYTLELPIRFLGGGPGPMDGWDEEFAKMKRIVSRVGGISPEIARMLRENGKKMSTSELRLVNKRICQDAIAYYTKDASEYEKIAAELDDMIYYAEWLKWFGDQAFSYLISTYYGSTADAIVSPAKDFFASLLGETIGKLAYGEKFDFDTLEVGKNINAAFDNLITNAFDDQMGKGVSFKQVCAVAGGFLVWKIAKNIYDNIDKDGKADLYSAITATTSDLTAMGMKKIAGNFFDKALKNKVVQENLNTPLGKWLQDIVPDTTLVKWSKDSKGKDIFKMIDFNKSDIFQKYLEEIFGLGMAKVAEIDMASAKGLHEITSGNSIESAIDLSAWPQIDWTTVTTDQSGQQEAYKISVNLIPESLDKLYDYLFGELFGSVPFAKEVKTPPVDPPYKPEGSLA